MIRAEAIRIPFRYAAGATSSAFLASLRDEQILVGSRCAACARVQCPPTSFCATCHGELGVGSLQPVGPSGDLVSWTRAPGRGAFGLVRLDGAHTALLHKLLGSEDDWRIGDRVRACFASERSGHICDLLGFEKETSI